MKLNKNIPTVKNLWMVGSAKVVDKSLVFFNLLFVNLAVFKSDEIWKFLALITTIKTFLFHRLISTFVKMFLELAFKTLVVTRSKKITIHFLVEKRREIQELQVCKICKRRNFSSFATAKWNRYGSKKCYSGKHHPHYYGLEVSFIPKRIVDQI